VVRSTNAWTDCRSNLTEISKVQETSTRLRRGARHCARRRQDLRRPGSSRPRSGDRESFTATHAAAAGRQWTVRQQSRRQFPAFRDARHLRQRWTNRSRIRRNAQAYEKRIDATAGKDTGQNVGSHVVKSGARFWRPRTCSDHRQRAATTIMVGRVAAPLRPCRRHSSRAARPGPTLESFVTKTRG